MTLQDPLNFCRICTNRKFNPELGLVCNLTNAKPTFETNCPTFTLDQPEANRLVQLEKQAQAEKGNAKDGFSAERAGIQKGVLGGILMIVIAVVWFFAGLAADRIFFYPPILFFVGIYALIKGISTGNFAGKK